MIRNTVLLLPICALLLTAGSRSANACGAWGLSDSQRGQKAVFYARTVKVSRPGSKQRTAIKIRGGEPATFTAIRGAWKRGKPDIMKIDASQVFLYGEKVGTFEEGDIFRLQDTEYRISVKFDREGYCSGKLEGGEIFSVSVVEKDQEVARGEAMSYFESCGGGVRVTKENRCQPDILSSTLADIRHRVGLYLVWRELVDGTPQTKSRPAASRPAVDDKVGDR